MTVYADSAEPKSIAELGSYGLTVKGCDKTAAGDRHNPITAQINFIKGYRLHFTRRSLNLIDEARNYVWDTDRSGERLNVPVKVRDHCMDAMRYAIYTPLSRFTSGQYVVSAIRHN